jgi:hypothetical protein
VAAGATGFQTRITANPRGSLASRAGSFSFFGARLEGSGVAGITPWCKGEFMPTTFQKRQKEMKRVEKRKMKEEKRAQKKIDKDAVKDVPFDPATDPTIDWNHSNEINS